MLQYKNKGRCKLCGDVIESKYRHDFVTCTCGALSLDGGLAYRRILWRSGNLDDVLEEIYEEITPQEIQKSAIISDREREREQEYYAELYRLLMEEEIYYGKTHGKRSHNGLRKRKVPVRTPPSNGEEAGEEASPG